MKTIQYGLMAAALLTMSCTTTPKDNKTATPDSLTVAEADTMCTFFGTYVGTLPAADCEGIKTTLTLNEDTTYQLISEYLGKGEAPVETNGVYEQPRKDLIIIITPSSGEKTYYKLEKGTAVLTDSIGSPNVGELADFYILKKK